METLHKILITLGLIFILGGGMIWSLQNMVKSYNDTKQERFIEVCKKVHGGVPKIIKADDGSTLEITCNI